ncbi:MAG: hypothetical protein IKI95_03275 [Clostridia bacterium]|nr:hypothetical protein [Clostridia bacterium]
MTHKEYYEILKKLDKELSAIKKYYYEKSDNAEMFEEAKRIYGITSIFNHFAENGTYYHYPAMPKKNILETLYDYLDKGGYDITEDKIHDMITDYQEENMDKYLIKGKLYTPILYGEEEDCWGDVEEDDKCGDCGCAVGQQHFENCDIERCPACGLQFISCDCGVKYIISKEDRKNLPFYIKQQEIDNIAEEKAIKEALLAYEKNQMLEKEKQEKKQKKKKSEAEM